MDRPRKKKQKLQPKEEQEKGRTESLYLHLLSPSPTLEEKFSVLYRIDSSPSEASFSQKPTPIPKGLPKIGFGSAICDSILYVFGGWTVNHDFQNSEVWYLDLVASSNGKSSSSFVQLKSNMKVTRTFPFTLTIGKKIYIFGSCWPGDGDFPADLQPWAEVFNTEDKLFKCICTPPAALFKVYIIGVAAVISNNSKILIAPNNFSHLFVYDVETDHWTHIPRDKDTLSPFELCSMRSPVIGNYVFLYGNGKICAYDTDKNQFLKNNISLLEYTFFDNEEEPILNGVIHHLGGWKFCVVFGDEAGHLVRFVYVISFEIESPECCGELNIKAGTINIVDHVLRADKFVDSLLWSNQIVLSGNPNSGKQSLKSNHIVGGSSVTSHVDDDCMMDNYGATSRPDLSQLCREVAVLSKLRRKEAALDKEMFEMRLQSKILIEEISKCKEKLPKGVHQWDFYLDSLEKSERGLSMTNTGECVKNENASEIKTECILEEISSTRKKVEAQLIERDDLIRKIVVCQDLVRSCRRYIVISSNFSESS